MWASIVASYLNIHTIVHNQGKSFVSIKKNSQEKVVKQKGEKNESFKRGGRKH